MIPVLGPIITTTKLVEHFNAHLLLVVILLQIRLHHVRQLQVADIVVRRVTDDRRAAQLLQRKAKVPVQRLRQHWLKEHDARGILVVLQQSRHCRRCVDARIVTVETGIEEFNY